MRWFSQNNRKCVWESGAYASEHCSEGCWIMEQLYNCMPPVHGSALSHAALGVTTSILRSALEERGCEGGV